MCGEQYVMWCDLCVCVVTLCVCVCVCGCERQTKRELCTCMLMERSREANLNKYNAKLIRYMFICIYTDNVLLKYAT